MALAFVEGQSVTNITGVATTPAFTNSFAVGQLVVVAMTYSGSIDSTTSVVDNATPSNTYKRISDASSAGAGQVLYYSVITTAKASPTVTVNFNSAATNIGVVVQYFNGFVDTPYIDRAKRQSNSSSTTVTSGTSPVLNKSVELVVGTGHYLAGTTTFSLGAGYTNLTQLNDSTNAVAVAMESLVTSSVDALAATFTLGAANANFGAILTFTDGAFNHFKFINKGLRPHPFSPGLAR